MLITTERLTIRPLTRDCLEATHAYASDIENTRYMCYLPNDTLQETLEFILRAEAEQAQEKPSFYEFAVFRGETQVGGISLFHLDAPDEAELGWILDRRYWGRGYAGEAARGLMDWARRELGIRRFIAQCDGENAASYRLMERLGMRRISVTGGRKNRSSDEERQELTYEIAFD